MSATILSSQRLAVVVCAAVAIATAVLVFHRLGASDICGGDEAVEAVFVQQMVEHGKLLFPVENGREPMYKPPMFHWTATALDWMAGIDRVTAGNLRATSALYAVAGIVLTMAFAYQLLGVKGAIFAGLALAGSYQYINQGRFGRVDMTLCFFESLALFLFAWWLPPRADSPTEGRPRQRGQLYLLALAMGLAVLSKGPVGALLPGVAMIAFMVVERRFRQILSLVEPGPLLVGVTIASSWYAACYLGGRFGFLNRQLGHENVDRFFGSLGSMAPWYYVKPVLLNSAPLSLLIPIAVAIALRPRRGRVESADEEHTHAVMRLFAIFWIATIVFFTIAAYKRRSYLLPLWPASAVMIAWLILSFARYSFGRAASLTFVAVCAGLISFNFVYIPRQEMRDCADWSYRPAAEDIKRVVGPNQPLYTHGFNEELAPLLFYLDRDAPILKDRLSDAPPGYVIVPLRVWRLEQGEALDLTPVLIYKDGERKLVLLSRGKA